MQKWWPTVGRFLGFLCTQKWASASKIAEMPPSLPILMLSGPRDSIILSEMMELWAVSRTRGPKRKTGLFISVLGWKDTEESVIRPEKDVFEIFDNGAYHFSEPPFSWLDFETSSSCFASAENIFTLLRRVDSVACSPHGWATRVLDCDWQISGWCCPSCLRGLSLIEDRHLFWGLSYLSFLHYRLLL